MVNSPAHYTVGGIETIDFIEAKDLSYHLGNAVKYISRAPHKGRQIEDLKKAAKDKENIYLAPDPDREGEAIELKLGKMAPISLNPYRSAK
jgi:DNA topoisomerase IA